MICTCLYLHKKVAPNDALNGMKMQFVRRNSYDDAIGIFQRRDSQSSGSSKGNDSPKLSNGKRSRFPSISKKKGNKKYSREEQGLKDKEESTTEENLEKDDGYTVKRGNITQQNKIPQKLKSSSDATDTYDKRYHTMSFSKSATTKRKGKVPPRLSLYPRRFDNIIPRGRNSTRMHTHHLPSSPLGTCTLLPCDQLHMRLMLLIDPNDLNINITSCTECNNCQRLVYDEDIMSNWSALDSDYNTK